MDYRNKLGIFSFNDDLSETLALLVASTVMGQYLNPKPGEPSLHNEQSCMDFIRERCGNVLSQIGFELQINHDMRKFDRPAEMEALVKLEQRLREDRVAKILADEDRAVKALKMAFPGSYLVGPAAVK